MGRNWTMSAVGVSAAAAVIAGTAGLDVQAARRAGAATPAPGRAPAAVTIVRAAIDGLARVRVFRTVTTSPSLEEVAVVEPSERSEATTSHLDGPAGRGVVRAVIVKGVEYLEGDEPGWGDLLRLVKASPSTVSEAAGLAGHWYVEPPARDVLVGGFGPTLGGIGHVFCVGRGCSLRGSTTLERSRMRVVVSVPSFGGDLVMSAPGRPRPLELLGTGARSGLLMRFVYPGSVPVLAVPKGAIAAPPSISG